MGKFNIDLFEPHQSFSHGRVKPVIVEKVDQRKRLLCSVSGTRMRLLSKSGQNPKFTASCPNCRGGDK